MVEDGQLGALELASVPDDGVRLYQAVDSDEETAASS